MTVGELVAYLKLDKSIYTKGLEDAKTEAKNFQQHSEQAFRDFERATRAAFIAVVAGFGLAIKQATEFEDQMTMVNTALGRDSRVSLETFRTGILASSKAFGESTKTLTKGLYDILGAAIPAEHALRVLNDSATAAVAGYTDTAVAADALTTVMNAYADTTYDSARASDILFATVIRGKIEFADLAGNIGMVASLAAQSGVSLEELGASMAIMTRNGIDAETATTNLKGILSTLLDPSKELTEALGGLNVQNGDFVAIMEKMSDLPPDVLTKLFPNIRAMTGIVTSAKEMASEVEIIQELIEGGSPTMEAYDKATASVAFQWKQLKAELNAAAIEMGGNLLPIFRSLMDAVTKGVTWFGGLSETMQRIIVTTLALVAGMYPMIKLVQGVVAVVNMAKIAWIALNTTFLATPLGLIVVGLTAVAGAAIMLATRVKETKTQVESLNAAAEAQAKTYAELSAETARLQEESKTHTGTMYDLARASVKLALAESALKTASGDRRKQLLENQETLIAEVARLEALAEAEGRASDALGRSAKETNDLSDASKALVEEYRRIEAAAAVMRSLGEEVTVTEDKHDALMKAIEDLIEKGHGPQSAAVLGLIDLYKKQSDVAAEATKATADAAAAASLSWEQFVDDYVAGVDERIVREREAREQNDLEESLSREKKREEQAALNQGLLEDLDVSLLTERDRRLYELEKQALAYQMAGADRVKLEKWVAEQKKKIIEETTKSELSAIDKTKAALEDLGNALIKTFASSVLSGLEAFGEAMGYGESATKAVGTGLKSLGRAILAALPQMLLMAGLQLLPFFPVGTIIGVGLLISSGLAAWANGLLSGADAAAAETVAADIEAQDNADAALEELRRSLLSPRERELEDMESAIDRFRESGASEADIAAYRAAEMERINEDYPAMKDGGMVGGPAGVDASVIRATKGEYVMPVQQTSENLALLEAIRATGSLSISPASVSIELDGKVVGRAMIPFIQDESDLGSLAIASKSVRPSQ